MLVANSDRYFLKIMRLEIQNFNSIDSCLIELGKGSFYFHFHLYENIVPAILLMKLMDMVGGYVWLKQEPR